MPERAEPFAVKFCSPLVSLEAISCMTKSMNASRYSRNGPGKVCFLTFQSRGISQNSKQVKHKGRLC
ncbi:hypothetical protein VIM7927_04184 [Vibrio mangrovi]|uniref:Uncharacterized protein n=1 Tax=Vibrio mangrovi TaxID=474394 RepID=A0A1Y6J2B8_9VIBR|nr:hypothetical protein VIM7927_04184 [Vibrio mangrovi]